MEERDYLHVCDAASATLAALQQRSAGAYDIGTGVGTRTRDLVSLIARLARDDRRGVIGTHASEEPTARRLVASTDRARRAFGFSARRALADGLSEEIGWMRSQLAPAGPLLAATA